MNGPKNVPVAVVLHSGGLDSTVCLLLAREQGREVVSLGIDYKQRHRVELEFAALQCERFSIPRRVVSVTWDKPKREIPLDRSVDDMRGAVSQAFLPARNVLFLSLGLAEAAGLGANELWIGVNSIDFSGYPDCRPEFIEAFSTMAAVGVPGGPRVLAPLQLLSKPEIAAQALRLGLHQGDTWSCYTPTLVDGLIAPCGRCDACRLHSHAWQGVASLTANKNL